MSDSSWCCTLLVALVVVALCIYLYKWLTPKVKVSINPPASKLGNRTLVKQRSPDILNNFMSKTDHLRGSRGSVTSDIAHYQSRSLVPLKPLGPSRKQLVDDVAM